VRRAGGHRVREFLEFQPPDGVPGLVPWFRAHRELCRQAIRRHALRSHPAGSGERRSGHRTRLSNVGTRPRRLLRSLRSSSDSPLEGTVCCELVSEMGLPAPRRLRPDSRVFMDDGRSVRAPFGARPNSPASTQAAENLLLFGYDRRLSAGEFTVYKKGHPDTRECRNQLKPYGIQLLRSITRSHVFTVLEGALSSPVLVIFIP